MRRRQVKKIAKDLPRSNWMYRQARCPGSKKLMRRRRFFDRHVSPGVMAERLELCFRIKEIRAAVESMASMVRKLGSAGAW